MVTKNGFNILGLLIFFMIFDAKPLLAQNVGIGTTGPTEKLQINDFLNADSSYLKIASRGENFLPVGGKISGLKLLHFSDVYGFTIESYESNSGLDTLPRGLYFSSLNGSTKATPRLFINRLGGNVGIGTTTPDASAQLEVASTSRGILIPRMTTAQRTAIANPANGLLVFDRSTNSFWFTKGNTWTEIGTANDGWKLSGNTGNNASYFLGTVDEQPLQFRVNDKLSGYLSSVILSSTSFGYESLSSNTGQGNVGVGYWALRNNTTGVANTAVGNNSLIGTISGSYNTALGQATLSANEVGERNTAIGFSALNKNKGAGNTATGALALFSNTTGESNSANGSQALYSNTTGSFNTANGLNALLSNTTGIYNTANGAAALFSNTTGNDNTAYGERALFSNTTGNGNTANGRSTLFSNTSGFSNVAVGIRALYSNTNRSNLVAIGDSALYNNGVGATSSEEAIKNTAVGSKALFANTIGDNNTANGADALRNNTAGFYNTANGADALRSNTTGFSNTANGVDALRSNTLGYNNTANGAAALFSNTTGNDNTANGAAALLRNTTGFSNVAVGISALYNNTNRGNLVAIGDSALYNNGVGATSSGEAIKNTGVGSKALFANTTGFFNTATGANALRSNITGIYNTANGADALLNNTTGSNNTANGTDGLRSNTTGFSNTANGSGALYSNTTGAANTANGTDALRSNTEGINNAANGAFALRSNTTGFSNTANGVDALRSNTLGYNNTANGAAALSSNTTGNDNTANGERALFSNTTGSGNTAIGRFADVTTGNLSNATAIGANARVGCSNCLVLGNNVNVGIGTSNPTNKLQVTGNALISGQVSATAGAVFGTGASDATVNIYGPRGIALSGAANDFITPTGEAFSFGNYSKTTSSQVIVTETFRINSAGNVSIPTGNLSVSGSLSKGSGSFKIDHPLDPANKYLYHSFVESPDMMNVYNGNTTTNAKGEAVVEMPDWFEALNKDFRYQLTVIGTFAQAIIKDELKGNQFSILTDKPNVKVSWQITGIRHDAFADKNRIPVEVDKPRDELGTYLHSEAFGQPIQKGLAEKKIVASTASEDAGER